MDRDLLALLMEYLLSRQTAGRAETGGDLPYDDYNMQDTIGGLGAVDPNTYPYEDWADTGIGGPAADQFSPPMGTPAIGADPGIFLPPPMMPNVPRYQPGASPRAEQMAPVLTQLQAGLEQRQNRPQPTPKSPEKERTVKTLPKPATAVQARPKPASPAASPQASQAVRRISTAGTNAVRTPPPAAPAPKFQGPLNLLVRKTNAVRSR